MEKYLPLVIPYLNPFFLFHYFRRPVAVRVKDIGVWLQIMEALGRISVVANVNSYTYLQ